MRIFISGTACQGKTTLLNDFLQKWPMYKTADFDYRKLITEKIHSKHATKELQWNILNGMVDEIQTWRPNTNIIMDRGPLDNLVYSIWSCEKGESDIDKAFVDKCIPIVRESFRMVDMILFVPITESSPVNIVEDGVRETDSQFITEIDNLFKGMQTQWENQTRSQFWPTDDVPGFVEVFGSREERIKMLEMYIGDDGDVLGDEHSVFNPKEIDKLERQFGLKPNDKFAL